MYIDIIYLTTFLIGIYIGYKNPIFKFIGYIATFLVLLFFIIQITPPVNHLLDGLSSERIKHVYNFSLLLSSIIILSLFYLLKKYLLNGIFGEKGRNLDKIISSFLVSMSFIFLLSSIFWFVNKVDLLDNKTKEDSKLFYRINSTYSTISNIKDSIYPAIKKIKSESEKTIDKIKKSHNE